MESLMRKILGITGFVIFCFAIGFGCWLLNNGKLSGAEFVAFAVSFTVIGGIVSFAPEVQEFSIVGNIVKLKEVRNEAIERLKSLQKAQVELWRFILRSRHFYIPTHPSRPNDSVVSEDFWVIYREAEKLGAIGLLKDDLSIRLNEAILSSYSDLRHLKPEISLENIERTTYLTLAGELLSAEALDEICKRWDFNYSNPIIQDESKPTPPSPSEMIGRDNFVIYIKKRLEECAALEVMKGDILKASDKTFP
jgi:hypothetical protein